MNYFLRVILFIISLIILVYFGQFIFSYVYYWFPQNNEPSWFGNKEGWSLLFGAIFAFYFFLSLLIVLFFNKYKYYLLPINIIILLPILWVFKTDLVFDGALIGLSVAGWLIGEGILLLSKKMKK